MTTPADILAVLFKCKVEDLPYLCNLIDAFLPNREKQDKLAKLLRESFAGDFDSTIKDTYYTALDAAVIELGFEDDLDDEFFKTRGAGQPVHYDILDLTKYKKSGLFIIINSKPRRCKNYADILKYLKLWRKKHESLLRVSPQQV